MFWGFLIFAALALVFVQLGAYSAWFAILKGALQLAIFVITGFVIVLIWRQVFRRKNDKQSIKGSTHV
jgi:membrane protein implicated in regulation of membrane protease activity